MYKGTICRENPSHYGNIQYRGLYTANRQKVRKRWKTPANGDAKLNTDDAFSGNGAATGMALLDHNGEVILSGHDNF
jgi:hypothetical protein